MEISFIHTQILVHLHVNKNNFHNSETEAKGKLEIAYLWFEFCTAVEASEVDP